MSKIITLGEHIDKDYMRSIVDYEDFLCCFCDERIGDTLETLVQTYDDDVYEEFLCVGCISKIIMKITE